MLLHCAVRDPEFVRNLLVRHPQELMQYQDLPCSGRERLYGQIQLTYRFPVHGCRLGRPLLTAQSVEVRRIHGHEFVSLPAREPLDRLIRRGPEQQGSGIADFIGSRETKKPQVAFLSHIFRIGLRAQQPVQKGTQGAVILLHEPSNPLGLWRLLTHAYDGTHNLFMLGSYPIDPQSR